MSKTPLQIYPSQLDSIKTKAKALASLIADELNSKPLSAFKRNDYFSIALGYKGHPDLIESAKFRASSDTNQSLIIFLNQDVTNSIAEVFSSRIEGVSKESMRNICKKLSKNEGDPLLMKSSTNELKSLNPQEAKAIQDNANFEMFLDEDFYSSAAYEAGEFFKRIASEHTPKNSNIRITIDLSTVPTTIKYLLENNLIYRSFMNWLRTEGRKHNVSFADSSPGSEKKGNPDWGITARIDTWTEANVSDELLVQWTRFRNWLLSFYSTKRVHISERINSPRWATMKVQYTNKEPVEIENENLASDDDKIIFDALLNSHEAYFTKDPGHQMKLEKHMGDLLQQKGRKDNLLMFNKLFDSK
ncbi:MAG: hypothetical protein CBC55_01425 [Gammaproteobacteria bacterium TMED95]|nr:MAG: hypothetical protein CBC55_01425 [Gammaproteobacteria bacterium TMED95]|tara:strand:- start:6292 stop:7368 length:1077 start_codon:yes stop_codon:yes gene_type:complete